MYFFSNSTISGTGGAMPWIYGVVLIIVVIYTIIALRKQAKKAEDRNKQFPENSPGKNQDKKLKK